jgi:hypothetical protein
MARLALDIAKARFDRALANAGMSKGAPALDQASAPNLAASIACLSVQAFQMNRHGYSTANGENAKYFVLAALGKSWSEKRC